MRATLLVLLLALALAVPGARAASSSLTLAGPTDAVASGSVVPLAVRVELRDFWCSQPREVSVEATVRGSGAEATLANGTLRFTTDDAAHFADAWVAEGNLSLAVRALGAEEGVVEVVASLSPPADCVATDGFTPASANATLRVRPAPAPEASPPPANDAAPPEANETAASNESMDANATQESVGGRPAPPGSGFIGDYRPPGEVERTPGPAVAVVALALVVAAVGLRRKR